MDMIYPAQYSDGNKVHGDSRGGDFKCLSLHVLYALLLKKDSYMDMIYPAQYSDGNKVHGDSRGGDPINIVLNSCL